MYSLIKISEALLEVGLEKSFCPTQDIKIYTDKPSRLILQKKIELKMVLIIIAGVRFLSPPCVCGVAPKGFPLGSIIQRHVL